MKIKLANTISNPRSYNTVGDKQSYIMNTAKMGTSKFKTENINACIAGVVSNGKKNLMFHLAPEQQSLLTLDDIFLNKMRDFCSETDNELDALVCGGWNSSTKNNTTTEQSINLYNKIAELLENFGVRLSLICGKKQNELDNLYAQKDQAILVSDSWNNYGINCNNLKNKTIEEISKLLENKYETVEIHPKHEFIA